MNIKAPYKNSLLPNRLIFHLISSFMSKKLNKIDAGANYFISVATQRDLLQLCKLGSVGTLNCMLQSIQSAVRATLAHTMAARLRLLDAAAKCLGVWGGRKQVVEITHAASAVIFQLFRGYNYVTTKTIQSIRLNALALATALALASPALLAAGSNSTARVNMGAIGTDTQFDRFIVKYREGTPEAKSATTLQRALNDASVSTNQLIQADRLQKGLKSAPTKPLSVGHVRRMSLGADVIASSQKLDRTGAATLMRQIAANPNVEYVEIDAILRPTLTPNDTSYSSQWGYQDADAGIRANQAWDVATGSGIIVAVIDTGITSHSDLNANIVAGYDFISNTTTANDGGGRDSSASDPGDWTTAGSCYSGSPASNSSWHGTHVAGTVAAVTNNAKGVAGTAFNAKVMPVRALGTCGGSTSDIADAITWSSGGTVSGVTSLSAANVAKVINMSLGGGGTCSTTSQNAINGAVGRGTTVVVAAGNSNADVANFNPASCNNVIAVASVTASSARSSFSNYGAKIDVSGPGSTIYSTMNSGTTTPGSETYTNYSGTSMASPHVAGTVALIQSRRLALGLALYTPAEVESLLKSTAYALAGSCTGGCGAGIINAKAAVDAAGGSSGGTTQTYSNTADYTISDNVTVDSPITVSGRTGNAPSNASFSVNIVHTYRGDLKVDLVAPDGSLYNVSNRAGGSADNLVGTYTVNLSTEALNGTWKLRVNDNAAGDTGYINSWSITF
jgi:serine protease